MSILQELVISVAAAAYVLAFVRVPAEKLLGSILSKSSWRLSFQKLRAGYRFELCWSDD